MKTERARKIQIKQNQNTRFKNPQNTTKAQLKPPENGQTDWDMYPKNT